MSTVLTSPFRRLRAAWLPLLAALAACSTATPTSVAPSATNAASTELPGSAAISSPALPLDPRVTQGTLKNGLTYLLQRQKPEDQRAYLMLVVKAGSMYEDDDQRGFAHLTEHMAFNGTKQFEKQTLIDFFEKSGIKFGSDTNASTGYDRTVYSLQVPTDQPELLLRGLDILSEWAGAVTFDPEEVEKERPVVLAEWTRALGSGRRMFEQVTRTLLAGSRYVDRDVLGDKQVLQQGPRQRLLDFYRRWYTPDRMAVVVAGDIEPKALQAAIEQRFSSLQRNPDPGPLPDLSVPIGNQARAAVLTDPELTASAVSLIIKAPPRPERSEVDSRDILLAHLATGMLSRRLSELAEDPAAPFTGAASQYAPNSGGQMAVTSVGAQIKQTQLAQALHALLIEVERVKRHGYTKEELERMQRDVLRSMEHQVAAKETVHARAIASILAQLFITDEVMTSPEFNLDFTRRFFAEISLADVNRVGRELFSSGERVVIASGPSRDALPDQSSLVAALDSAAREAVEPYRYKVAQGQLLPELPAPGRVVSEEHIAEIDTTLWKLSNGAVVVLKPTDFKEDEILEQSVSPGGTAGVPLQRYSSARFADSIVARSGVGNFDRQSLAKVLTGTRANASPWIQEQEEGIGASGAPQDVETMFQLMYLYATAPRRDEAAFEAFRSSMREGLRNRDLDPGTVFGDAIAKKVWGDSPRRSAPTLKTVDEIDLDQALRFYNDRFKDFSDFAFVFVGKIDLAKFKPLVERYLASLPGGGRKEKRRDIGLHRRKGITKVSVRAGKEDKAVYSLIFHGESPWSENTHTDLYELGEYLSMRLREVLREEMGGTYAPQVGSSFNRVPFDDYSLQISFDAKPKDVGALEQAARRIIAEVKKSGVAESYLEKLRSERTRDLEQSYRSNGFWLSRLVDKYRLHEDPRQILILPELTKRITSDNLRAAARRLLRDDQYIEARLLPAAEATAPGAPPPAAGAPSSRAPAPPGSSRASVPRPTGSRAGASASAP